MSSERPGQFTMPFAKLLGPATDTSGQPLQLAVSTKRMTIRATTATTFGQDLVHWLCIFQSNGSFAPSCHLVTEYQGNLLVTTFIYYRVTRHHAEPRKRPKLCDLFVSSIPGWQWCGSAEDRHRIPPFWQLLSQEISEPNKIFETGVASRSDSKNT